MASAPQDSQRSAATPVAKNTGNKTSKHYRGIRQTSSGKWSARVKDTSAKKQVHLGSYNTAEEAALAYDEAALKFQVRGAKLNFPDHFATRTEALTLEKQLDQTLQEGSSGQGGQTKDVSVDTQKDAVILTQDFVIKAEGTIVPFEEKKTLLEQLEEVEGEIDKRITEKAKIEEYYKAIKEAKDHQIASLKLKKIVLEEDIADFVHDSQAASLDITADVNLVIGSISREPTKRKVGLKVCSYIKMNNQVLSTEVTSQVDSPPILEKNGDNLVSEKYETNDRRDIHNDLDAEKNHVGQLFSSGAHGSVTRNIEELLSLSKKLKEAEDNSSRSDFEAIQSHEAEDKEDEHIEQLQVVTNGSGKFDSLVSGGQLEIKSSEEVHKKKGVLGGCVLSGNNGVVEGSEIPSYSEGDGQLQNAGDVVQKRKGVRPRKFDGFVLPSDVPRKRKKGTFLECDAENSLPRRQKRTKKEKDVREELVGSRIKVWWPADQQYFEGTVESYDPARKKHRVAYIDGMIDNLMLKKEQWLQVDEKSDSQQDQVVPSASAMPASAAEPEIESKSNKDEEPEKAV